MPLTFDCRRTALLLLGALLFAGCHRSSGWPEDDRRAFVQDCEKKNPAPGSCACVARALEKTMTWAEFQAFQDVHSGRAPPPEKMAKVRDAVAACTQEKR
jgi:hypothetical protein